MLNSFGNRTKRLSRPGQTTKTGELKWNQTTISNLPNLPPGKDLQWNLWKTINRLGIGVVRTR